MPQVSELIPALKDNEVAALPLLIGKCKYDFAVDGGVSGDIGLGLTLPSGALILGAYINVTTVPTSAGAATVAIKSEAAADLNAADAISGAPWSTTGWKAADKDLGAAPIKLTAARQITTTIGTADLTAGVFEVLVLYLAPGF